MCPPIQLKEHSWEPDRPFYATKRFCQVCSKWLMTCDFMMFQWTCPNCIQKNSEKGLDTNESGCYNDRTTLY